MNREGTVIAALLAVVLAIVGNKLHKAPQPKQPTPAPAPCPGPEPCPSPQPNRPWGASLGGTVAPDGQEIDIDTPMSQQLHNKGGSDGAGLCVFTSANNSANWQGISVLRNLRDWMTKYPGGGTPIKLEKVIARKCAEEGVPVPPYIQIEGLDLEILREACKSGRMPCITYCRSLTGRYGGRDIAHMVNLVHASGGYYGILDNNYVCTPEHPNSVEYLLEREFIPVHRGGGAWSVIFFEPPPPLLPRN